jgi:hypothetical protein
VSQSYFKAIELPILKFLLILAWFEKSVSGKISIYYMQNGLLIYLLETLIIKHESSLGLVRICLQIKPFGVLSQFIYYIHYKYSVVLVKYE